MLWPQDPRGGSQELEEVAQVQVVLVHGAETAQQPLDRRLDGARRCRVQREIAERQAPGHNLERNV